MVARQENPEQIAERGAAAYREATTGDFRASEAWLRDHAESDSDVTQAWSLALRAQRFHAEPEKGELPARVAIAALVDGNTQARIGAALAATEAAKRAVLLHQVGELEAWTALQQELADGLEDAWAIAWAKMSLAWALLASGDWSKAQQIAQAAQDWAASHGVAPAVIEATVIRALCAEETGDIAEATSLARRGSRMARTEDLPQWQYLANVVLARMRRLNGFPHLTTRILEPLSQVAPKPWNGWVAWELLMAGARALPREIKLDDSNDPTEHVRRLRRLITAASEGDPQAFSTAVQGFAASAPTWPSRHRDLDVLIGAIDARADLDEVDEELASWYAGTSPSPPKVVKGFCVDLGDNPDEAGAAAFVVARADEGNSASARRIAGLGEPILRADMSLGHIRVKSERTPTVLAALAFAGRSGIVRDELFPIVYGFPYDQGLHRNLFNVMIRRARLALGDWGELKRVGQERFVLELRRPLVIPDPRCEQSLEDVMLRALARMGASSAKGTAAEAGVPLRSAQTALKHLVEEGALVAERKGNAVTYRIEDTTFSEPTKWR